MSAINFIGREHPECRRILTGFYSLDKATGGNGNRGYPVGTMTEFYGNTGVGKTTIMVSLAAIFARELGGRIAFADFERQNYDLISNALEMNGFIGDVDLLIRKELKKRKKKEDDEVAEVVGTQTHEDMLDTMIEELHSGECNVALLDSIGAFAPVAELEGSVADASMGQKARVVGNWTRQVIYRLGLSDKPDAMCMYVTHQHPPLSKYDTVHTSGGVTKNFLNSQRIELKKKDDYNDGWLVEGCIKKARHGKSGNIFRMFVIGGQGAHIGMSAVFDCVSAGLATAENGVIRIDTQSFGRINKMVENWQDREMFTPFINALIAREMPVEEPVEEVLGEEPKKRGRKKGG